MSEEQKNELAELIWWGSTRREHLSLYYSYPGSAVICSANERILDYNLFSGDNLRWIFTDRAATLSQTNHVNFISIINGPTVTYGEDTTLDEHALIANLPALQNSMMFLTRIQNVLTPAQRANYNNILNWMNQNVRMRVHSPILGAGADHIDVLGPLGQEELYFTDSMTSGLPTCGR